MVKDIYREIDTIQELLLFIGLILLIIFCVHHMVNSY